MRSVGACLLSRNALHYNSSQLIEDGMTAPAERMRIMRERRRRRSLRELRLIVPDARSETIRSRIAAQVARLSRKSELEALDWIEGVSEFDADEAR
jgi:hypothetical protein